MAPKESSDNVVTAATIVPARRSKSASDYVALAIATCGVGYLPIAPGTWGSAVGVAIYMSMRAAFLHFLRKTGSLDSLIFPLFLLIGIFVITGFGIWAATKAETLFGKKDPGAVVVDEVSGQLITFLFLPLGASFGVIVVGFILFRLFDIFKPYPIRRLEALGGGLGIMADDVLAGVYAATLLQLLLVLLFFLFF